MEERNYKVYIHENKINGKRYVGITKQIPNKRWKNGKGYVGNEYFTNAINKYGWDNFNHEILKDGLTKTEAEEIEIRLINEYKSADREHGYNIEYGGNVSGTHSEETIQKIKDAISGENHYLYGKHPSEETRKRMSNSRKRGKNHKAKIVICESNEFLCAKDCAEYYGISYKTMDQWLNRKVKMPICWYVLGLRYKSVDMREYIKEDKEHWSIGKGIKNGGNSKNVEIFKDGESLGIFPSMSELERQSLDIFGVILTTDNISRVCNGKRKHHKGFNFSYV